MIKIDTCFFCSNAVYIQYNLYLIHRKKPFSYYAYFYIPLLVDNATVTSIVSLSWNLTFTC